MHNVDLQSLSREDLLALIQDAQIEMIGRYTPDMGYLREKVREHQRDRVRRGQTHVDYRLDLLG